MDNDPQRMGLARDGSMRTLGAESTKQAASPQKGCAYDPATVGKTETDDRSSLEVLHEVAQKLVDLETLVINMLGRHGAETPLYGTSHREYSTALQRHLGTTDDTVTRILHKVRSLSEIV